MTIIRIIRTASPENKSFVDRIEANVCRSIRKYKIYAYEENADPMTVMENAEKTYIEYPSFCMFLLNASLRIYAKRPGDKYPSMVFNVSPGDLKNNPSITADKVTDYIDAPDHMAVNEMPAPEDMLDRYDMEHGKTIAEFLDFLGGKMAGFKTPRRIEDIMKDIVKTYAKVLCRRDTGPVRIKGKNRFNGTVEADPIDLKAIIDSVKSDIKALTRRKSSLKFEPEFDKAKVVQTAFRNVYVMEKHDNEIPEDVSGIIGGLLENGQGN